MSHAYFALIAALAVGGADGTDRPTPGLGIKIVDMASREFQAAAAGSGILQVTRHGMLVSAVDPDGMAARIGIQKHDAIVFINNTFMTDAHAFKKFVNTRPDWGTCELSIVRPREKGGFYSLLLVGGKRRPPSSLAFKLVGDGRLDVRARTATAYLPGDGTAYTMVNAVEVKYIVNDREQEATDGSFKIDGTPTRLAISSGDEKVATVAREAKSGAWTYRFLATGKARFRVSLADAAANIEINVVKLAVSLGDSSDKVTGAYGPPDFKDRYLVSGPKTEAIDGITYAPRVGETVSVQHWRYDALPGAVFAIRDSKLAMIGSAPRYLFLVDSGTLPGIVGRMKGEEIEPLADKPGADKRKAPEKKR
jgi:hypothetical protein